MRARESQAGARLVLRAGSCGARCSTVSRRVGGGGEEPSPEKRDTSVLPVKGPSRVNTGRGALRGLAKWEPLPAQDPQERLFPDAGAGRGWVPAPAAAQGL